jgi:hypothetical protein
MLFMTHPPLVQLGFTYPGSISNHAQRILQDIVASMGMISGEKPKCTDF